MDRPRYGLSVSASARSKKPSVGLSLPTPKSASDRWVWDDSAWESDACWEGTITVSRVLFPLWHSSMRLASLSLSISYVAAHGILADRVFGPWVRACPPQYRSASKRLTDNQLQRRSRYNTIIQRPRVPTFLKKFQKNCIHHQPRHILS